MSTPFYLVCCFLPGRLCAA